MVNHLKKLSNRLKGMLTFSNDDIILDIGSNDGTLLQYFNDTNATLVGIDPSGDKFSKYYPSNIQLIPEFFSSSTFKNNFGSK